MQLRPVAGKIPETQQQKVDKKGVAQPELASPYCVGKLRDPQPPVTWGPRECMQAGAQSVAKPRTGCGPPPSAVRCAHPTAHHTSSNTEFFGPPLLPQGDDFPLGPPGGHKKPSHGQATVHNAQKYPVSSYDHKWLGGASRHIPTFTAHPIPTMIGGVRLSCPPCSDTIPPLRCIVPHGLILRRLKLHGQNHTKCTQLGPCKKKVFHRLCFLKTEY